MQLTLRRTFGAVTVVVAAMMLALLITGALMLSTNNSSDPFVLTPGAAAFSEPAEGAPVSVPASPAPSPASGSATVLAVVVEPHPAPDDVEIGTACVIHRDGRTSGCD